MKSKLCRYISAFLIVCMMLLLCACNGKNTDRPREGAVPEITAPSPAAETTAIPSPTVPTTPTETPTPTPTQEPTPAIFYRWDRMAEGSIVTYGAYEQDNDETNGKEPIEWIVLEKQDNRIMVISRFGLDCQPYHDTDADVNWENSGIRKWLNKEFIEEAFSNAEESFLMNYSIGGVKDKVFLLSSEEAAFFLNKVRFAQCTVTAYAANNGAGTSSKNNGNCWWWLRSKGANAKYAAYVGSAGEVFDIGDPVTSDNDAVRPVIWIQKGEKVTENTEPVAAISVPLSIPISSNRNKAQAGYPTPVIDKEVLYERKDCPTVGVQKPSAKGLEYKKQADEGGGLRNIIKQNPLQIHYESEKTDVRKTQTELPTYYRNYYVQIFGLKDKEIENAINQRIRDVYEAMSDPGFYPKQRGIVEHIREPNVVPVVQCSESFNYNNLLGILCTYELYRGEMQDGEMQYTCLHRYFYPLNFNLENGKELCLADLVPEGEEFLPILNELVNELCQENPLWKLSCDNYFVNEYGYERSMEFIGPPVWNEEMEYDGSFRTVFRGIDANQKFVLVTVGYGIQLLFDSDTPGMEWAHDIFWYDGGAASLGGKPIHYATKQTPISIFSVAQYDDIFEDD